MVQLSMELEEAARMAGATWVRTFRRIVLPLLAPTLAIGWLMFMVTVTRDLSTVILLYGPTSKTLAVSFFGHWKAGTLEDAAVVGVIMTLFGVGLAMGIFALQRVGRGSEQPLL
jgi:iron(III) transport system permease protein